MVVKDEFRLHLFYISKLIMKYSKILVFAPDGESGIFGALEEKFPNVNFYYQSGAGEIKEPFVFSIMSLDSPNIPVNDIIYCLQYTTEYKELQTGYKFPVGQWMPMSEYSRMAAWQKLAGKNISGKIVKSFAELKKLME